MHIYETFSGKYCKLKLVEGINGLEIIKKPKPETLEEGIIHIEKDVANLSLASKVKCVAQPIDYNPSTDCGTKVQPSPSL